MSAEQDIRRTNLQTLVDHYGNRILDDAKSRLQETLDDEGEILTGESLIPRYALITASDMEDYWVELIDTLEEACASVVSQIQAEVSFAPEVCIDLLTREEHAFNLTATHRPAQFKSGVLTAA